jgi:hypothetical protein
VVRGAKRAERQHAHAAVTQAKAAAKEAQAAEKQAAEKQATKKGKQRETKAQREVEAAEARRDQIAEALQQEKGKTAELQMQNRALGRALRQCDVKEQKADMLVAQLEQIIAEGESKKPKRNTAGRGEALERQVKDGAVEVVSDGRALSQRHLRRVGGDILSLVFAKSQGSICIVNQVMEYISSGCQLASDARWAVEDNEAKAEGGDCDGDHG